MTQSQIRNFAIIAHIDHGKSTLADRLLEMTGTVQKRDMTEQTLDSHPISRERGITIKLAPVTMKYKTLNNLEIRNTERLRHSKLEIADSEFTLNLIDTPGHVDFSYEVERSLAACEGVILLVDATQGIQAQTLSNFYKASKLGLTIIAAINKIDMPNAKIEQTEKELKELLTTYGTKTSGKIHQISAKTGQGIKELLEDVIKSVPPPLGNPQSPPRGLIFSSQYDPKRGVVIFVRLVDGQLESNQPVKFLIARSQGITLEIGHFTPKMAASQRLMTGEVGYIVTNIKQSENVKVGDTVTTTLSNDQLTPLAGYKEPQPMVFVSFFPVDANDYALLAEALNQLKLNDAALTFFPTSSKALGRGFRCGFLGHLHAEVSQERLEKDFSLSILATSPTVEYKAQSGNEIGNWKLEIENSWLEPWVKATIITPADYLGSLITLCQDKRGVLIDMTYLTNVVTLHYELPLAEIITDFFDQLKSLSSGFASIDYEPIDFRPFESVQLDILINNEEIDAFCQIMEKSKALKFGKFLVERLKDIIPRQQIPIPIQASINGQIIARADIAAFRKDVTAKLYGGDVTRRNKLLEKQKKGKEKMKQIGKITIPNDTFLKIFKT